MMIFSAFVALIGIACKYNDNSLASEKPETQLECTYLTWKNYDGLTGRENATLVWNGEEIGSGQRGVEALNEKIKLLPERSRVIIFPTYFRDATTKPREYPFDFIDLIKKMEAKHLIYEFSYYDREGKYVGATTSSYLCAGPGSENRLDRKDGVNHADRKPSVTLNWRPYSGMEDPADAVYYWNGERIGKGDVGEKALLEKLSELKAASHVLIFPTYHNAGVGGDPLRLYPFDIAKVDQIAKDRKLIIEFSYYDEKGSYWGLGDVSERIDYSK